jgi:prepilin-type N-terminal cleavage/methylation domain-containing protein
MSVDAPPVSRPSRARGEAGYTLVELLVVMVILSAVLLGLTAAFVSGLNSQVHATNRAQEQADARMGLNRMREDIHCANAVQNLEQNAYGGFTLTLTETYGVCPGTSLLLDDGTHASGVQWCTIPFPGSTLRYRLFREAQGECDGQNATMEIDYISLPPGGWPQNTTVDPAPTSWAGNIWAERTCDLGNLPTVPVDIDINLDPIAEPQAGYELKDRIALRNATVTSACS